MPTLIPREKAKKAIKGLNWIFLNNWINLTGNLKKHIVDCRDQQKTNSKGAALNPALPIIMIKEID